MPVSRTFWDSLNKGWPEDMSIPSDKAAINGVKRLYRHVRGKPWGKKVVVVHGRNRRTWTRRGVLVVAPYYGYPKQGWPAICHDLSHFLHSRMHPGAKPHDSRQARIERALQKYVIERLL